MVNFKKDSSSSSSSPKLGILSFETAKTMSRLISIYKSLSDTHIHTFKSQTLTSKGLTYLNSSNQHYLLSLASSELLENLDRISTFISRLSVKCHSTNLTHFPYLHSQLKLGIVPNVGKFEYGTKKIERKLKKMEKLVATTSCLHKALEGLTELEISERKVKQLKQMQLSKANFDLFYDKLENQRRDVRKFRESSLWVKSFDKSVKLMSRVVCVVYSRLRSVFRPYLSEEGVRGKEAIVPHSGPMLSACKPSFVRFNSQRSGFYDDGKKGNGGVVGAAGEETLGGSGLALRYANVILLVEKYLESRETIEYEDREGLYQMLPENLKALVRVKLSKNMRFVVENDEMLAQGWREAMNEIMSWLAPMAENTVTWQMERNFEKMKFDAKPNVLLLETLHFSDREKTEAAIVEVLVGLSCICRFENRQ